MPQLFLSIEEEVLQRLLERALKYAVPLEDQINEILARATATPPPQQMDFSNALATAVGRAAERPSAEEFLLENLFSPEEWRLIPTPKVLGREFRKEVERQGIAVHTGRTASNKAIYRRQ